MRALRYAARRYRESRGVCLMLLNVQLSAPPSALFPMEIVREHQEQMAEKCLVPARRVCKRFGIACRASIQEGDPADIIASLARRSRCGEIVMGTRGLGRISGLMLGSVATKVIHLATVPVTLIK